MSTRIVRPYVFLLGAVALLSGCSRGPLAPRDYLKWLADEDHGLVQERSFDDLSLRLEYRPAEQMALQEKGLDATAAELAPAIAARKGAHYFNLRMRSLKTSDLLTARAQDEDDYFRRQYYFSSLVENDLSLVIGEDTLPCSLVHFERTYGAVPFNNLVMSFVDDHEDPLREDVRLLYDDHAFDLGKVEFTIRKEDLQRIPALKCS